MSTVSSGIERVKTFIEEVKAELKKSAWPTRSELIESAMVIILSVVMLGVFVGASDEVLRILIGILAK